MQLLHDLADAYHELKMAQGNCGSPRVQRAHDRMVELLDKAKRLAATPEEIERARDEYATDDLEIDDDAIVSRMDESQGGDNGTWIAAWVWLGAKGE